MSSTTAEPQATNTDPAPSHAPCVDASRRVRQDIERDVAQVLP